MGLPLAQHPRRPAVVLSPQYLYKRLGAKLAVGMPFKDIATADSVILSEVPPSSDKDGRRALAYLLTGLALIDPPEAPQWPRTGRSPVTPPDGFVPEPVMRAPGLGPAQTAPMTPQEREERKRARRASAPKRAQRLARKAQRRRE